MKKFLVAILLFSSIASAGAKNSISGAVLSSSGRPVAGMAVLLTSRLHAFVFSNTNVLRVRPIQIVFTDANGRYTFDALYNGSYSVLLAKDSKQDVTISGFRSNDYELGPIQLPTSFGL